MRPEQLPPGARSKLDDLVAAIDRALKASRSPHTRAVSVGWSAEDAPEVLNGGRLRAPAKPPFDCDDSEIVGLHQAVIGAAGGVLCAVAVHAERPSAEGPWQLRTKLLSRAERRELEAARQPIDADVERALRRIGQGTDWEWISYGTRVASKPSELLRKSAAGLERLEAGPELEDLRRRAGVLYDAAGLDLVTAMWTVEAEGLEFEEYFT